MRSITTYSTILLAIASIIPASAMEPCVAQTGLTQSGVTLAQVISIPAPINAALPVADAVDAAPLIQIAVLLDTSNSMDGLINQARSLLWDAPLALVKSVRMR